MNVSIIAYMVFRIDCNIPGENDSARQNEFQRDVCPQALYYHHFVVFTIQTSSLYEISIISAQNSITVS